jgi:endonuclease-3
MRCPPSSEAEFIHLIYLAYHGKNYEMNDSIAKVLEGMRAEVGGEAAVILHDDPYKTLISTILSARTRDENTEKVVEKLFSEYSTPREIASAPLRKIEKLVRSSGFYKVKARRIKEVSRQIVKEFNGQTPDNLEDLLRLRGVGRKTANCVLVYAYGKPAIPVDVHVHRISNRLGWVKTKTPEETESELSRIVPRRFWIELNNLMVKYGRKICLPRKPKCGECRIRRYCRRVGVEDAG